MKSKNFWLNISILNLFIVSVLGFFLRSKILFPLKWINFLNLLDGHYHFAFNGWITLSLLILMVDSLLPSSQSNKPVYQWLFGFLVAFAVGLLAATIVEENNTLSKLFTWLLILVNYVFAWIFLTDIRKTKLEKPVRLLSVAAVISLLISTAGPLASAYLHLIDSPQIFYFTDASYIYLHFQYNGFFTLGIFALLFHNIFPTTSGREKSKRSLFSVLLCCSIVPSLFLSFLWQNPDTTVRIIALIGSLLVFASVTALLLGPLTRSVFSKMDAPVAKYLLVFSIVAFVIKMYLQSLTIFPSIGTAVFGDRPVIIGFLHLVFLGFVTPAIIAFYVKYNTLNVTIRLTGVAILIFMAGVALNELTLMFQGLGIMFLKSSSLFPWILWVISILLAAGALLILASRIKSINSLSRTK